jgi:hypothetical protein
LAANAAFSACPSDAVGAPVEVVWDLLTDAAGWGGFFDAKVLRIRPAGRAAPGQEVELASGRWPARFRLRFLFTKVDATEHRLGIDIRLPFGIRNDEQLSCVRVGPTDCRVSYGCNFVFPSGWRGQLLFALLRRGLETGPDDSLARLKRAAEERWTASQPPRNDPF